LVCGQDRSLGFEQGKGLEVFHVLIYSQPQSFEVEGDKIGNTERTPAPKLK
jgi:hypothetical protein